MSGNASAPSLISSTISRIVRPAKGKTPKAQAKRVTPKLHTSAAVPLSSPLQTSGAKKAGVPASAATGGSSGLVLWKRSVWPKSVSSGRPHFLLPSGGGSFFFGLLVPSFPVAPFAAVVPDEGSDGSSSESEEDEG